MTRRVFFAAALAALAAGSWLPAGAAARAIGPLLTVPPATAYYVAATGSDANAGTSPATAFATLGKCQTAMQGGAVKTCYIRAGSYAQTAAVSLGSSDAGETWSDYPADGPGTAQLTQNAAFSFFVLNTGADNVTINGLAAAGFEKSNHSSCNSTGESIFVAMPSSASVASPTISNNTVGNVDCGIFLISATNSVLSGNFVHDVEYAGIGCNGCSGTGSIWSGNVIYDLDTDKAGGNAYGVVFSTLGASTTTHDVTVENNKVINNANWECYDNHGGTNLTWENNLAVTCSASSSEMMESFSPGTGYPNNNTQTIGNIVDHGVGTNSGDTIIICGTSCGANTAISGGLIQNNYILNGSSSCGIAASPIVTISNPAATYCNSFQPETVSAVTFPSSATSASFTAGQPNAVVATLVVAMSSPALWAWPQPPGVLSIGGTNSGGFVVCNNNQICQPAGGTAPGTYNDFSVVATLHGMRGSPVTIAAGTLTLTGS